MPSVSVVICAWSEERWPQLVDAVASAHAQTVRPAEVIVAVDHNPALAARARVELDATVIENDGVRGLSGTRNCGVRAAVGEIVAFLDDDAVAEPEWIERLVEGYGDPTVLGVGGSIEPRWAGARPARFPAEFGWVIGCTYRGMPVSRGPVRNLIGANMSIRRDVLTAAGGFSDGIGRVGSLPVGCEETEFCIRARRREPDGRFIYEPSARVAHVVPRERATWRYFRRRCFAEGLSKASVAALEGSDAALATERRYVLRTLPRGVARGIRDALRGDPSGLRRAALIVAGLALTSAGYAVGTWREATR